MTLWERLLAASAASLACCGVSPLRATASEANPDGVYLRNASTQTEADEYTRYELLAPETASFRITYEVTATTAGAKVFYNPIRKGSLATEESVRDAMLGTTLHFEIVHGLEVRKDPLMPEADPATDYIKVALPRPVPPDGQSRLIISKTYKDPKSYRIDGNAIVFERPLGIPRNKIVLPPGYQLTSLSVPAQILREKDGRVAISFLHAGAGEAPLMLRAAPGAETGPLARPRQPSTARSWESPFEGETEQERLAERAHQDREIVYFLQQPETHSFRLYHDYTESRPGISAYANVVREGSTASDPQAVVLDTAERLPVQEMSGAEFARAHLNAGETVPEHARVVVIPFEPVKLGQSIRLRITETYTAPASYRLDGDELVFDRSLGRPRNAVVLPTGWYVTESSVPATVSELPDGRVRLDYWDDRPEAIDVLLKARRRPNAK